MRVRPAWPRDLETCRALDHSYTTDRVWQMEAREDSGVQTITFRVARLLREMRVNYPRQDENLLDGWRRRDGFLVAVEGRVHGYVALTAQTEHGIAWVGDLVVDRPQRRCGIGTALLQAAAQWGRDHDLVWLVVEVPTRTTRPFAFVSREGWFSAATTIAIGCARILLCSLEKR